MKHPHGFTKKQVRALWKSAEHWLQNWTNPESGTASASACECCNKFYDSSKLAPCNGCPIYQVTGHPHCSKTPYAKAEEALEYIQIYEYDIGKLEDIEDEYQFIIQLALGENVDDGHP